MPSSCLETGGSGRSGAEPLGGAGMTQRQLLEAGDCDCRSASGLSGLRQASGVWPRDAEQGGESGFTSLSHHGLGGLPSRLSLTRLLLRGLNEMMRSACGEQCSETVRRISPRSSLSVLRGSSLELRIFHRWGSGRLAVAAAPEGWG